MLTGGTACDLTSDPRETEVRFICNPDTVSSLLSVSETSTCRYMVVIATSALCGHPGEAALRWLQSHAIPCSLIPPPPPLFFLIQALPTRRMKYMPSAANWRKDMYA